MSVSDYSTIPDNNTSISGMNIAEGCSPSVINNAIRQIMADIASLKASLDTKDETIESLIASTKTSLESKIAAATMVGAIISFSGSFSGRYPIDMKTGNANTSWVICDGVATNGLAVPDLRNRFIRGGTGSNQKTTGGSDSHSHSVAGTSGATTLSVAQMPFHSHWVSDGLRYAYDASYHWGEQNIRCTWSGGHDTNGTGSSAQHSHSINIQSTSASNVPTFMALAYIMRIS